MTLTTTTPAQPGTRSALSAAEREPAPWTPRPRRYAAEGWSHPWPDFIEGALLTNLVALRLSWSDGARQRVAHHLSSGENSFKQLERALVALTPTAARPQVLRAMRRIVPLPSGVPFVVRSDLAPEVALEVLALIVPISIRQVFELADLHEDAEAGMSVAERRFEYACCLAGEWCLANGRGAIIQRTLTDPSRPPRRTGAKAVIVHTRTADSRLWPPRAKRAHSSKPVAPTISQTGRRGLTALPAGVALETLLPQNLRPVPLGASDPLSVFERRGLFLPGV